MYLLGCRSRLMGREVIEMCGALLWGPVWGFWWIFPVLGFLMCLAMAFRFWRSGAGCMAALRAGVIFGHDWGAIAAYGTAIIAPTRVTKLVTSAVAFGPSVLNAFLTNYDQQRRSWYMFFFQLRGISDRVVARDDFAFVEKLWRDWSPRSSDPGLPGRVDQAEFCGFTVRGRIRCLVPCDKPARFRLYRRIPAVERFPPA